MMNKYLLIKLVFGDEIHPDVYDLMLDEYRKASNDMSSYAAELDAELLIGDSVNTYGTGGSFVLVEHNFPLSTADKERLIEIVSRFFVDGEIEGRELQTFNVLSAVRFLQTEGELFKM
jgi:hypothetical protein